MKLKNFFKRKSKLRKIFAFVALAINLFAGGLKTNNSKTNTIGSSYKKESFEKVISNQEFNSFDGSYNPGKIYQIGNGTNLEFQQKIFQTSLMDEIIFVKSDGKNDGILPEVEGFPINSGFCRRSYIPSPRVPIFTPDTFTPDTYYTDLNARKRNTPEDKEVNQIYRDFLRELKTKGYFVESREFDIERFKELSINPKTNVIEEKYIIEAKTILQAEFENLVINARRPNLKIGEPDLDYKVDGPDSYKYADVKNPVDPKNYPSARKKPDTLDTVAENIAKSISKQRKLGAPGEILHIVDLDRVPAGEKEKMKEKIIKLVGSENHIKFFN